MLQSTVNPSDNSRQEYMTTRNRKISVFIVDDSAVVRQTLEAIIADDPCLTVAGVAADPLIAAEKLRQVVPDVIILDGRCPAWTD